MDYRSRSLDELARYSGDPWGPASAYYDKAELHMAWCWERLISPFLPGDIDYTETLDLAAGHGRNSEYLLKLAQRLTIMDIQPANIEFCKSRFSGHENISYHVCNGYDLSPIPDASLTFIYCFDAMVHFDSDVIRSYLRDAYRALKPGGRAFLHHSNYTGGYDWRKNPHSRNFMSKEMFAHYADKERLEMIKQEVIDWDKDSNLDCLTLLQK
jgi:SAM-dependent methyltransferase